MKVEFEVSHFIPASPDQVYSAWLDSDEHSAMTGGQALITDQISGSFEAWDGYITGKNLELVRSSRIFQQWRTSEFEESDEDSLLEILFESEKEGTRIIIRHTNLPEHGMQYKQGWRDAYFSPMIAYFEAKL
jgi:activator of HSP90 ATPase